MPISSGSQLIKFNIRGPFWSAGASAIRLDTPERHWSYRDLLVDISPLSALNQDALLLPGTRLALLFVDRVQVTLSPDPGATYEWERDEGEIAPVNPTLDEIRAGLRNGQLSLLLLRADPKDWPGTHRNPPFTCIAGEINLDVLSPADNARGRLYGDLALETLPSMVPGRAERLPGLLSVHSSGLSIFGQMELPWQDTKVIAPFHLARLYPDADPQEPSFRLTIESKRLTGVEKREIITAWGNLSAYINPDNPANQIGFVTNASAPAWVTLEISNPDAMPRLYWALPSWTAAPETLDLRFERGEFNLLLSDDSPYRSPSSLARIPLEDVGIQKQENPDGLLITLESGDPPVPEDVRGLSYNACLEDETWCESYDLTDVHLAFSPVETPRLLRKSQGLPSPGYGPMDELPVLWGFMPMEDGWAQIPIPNLNEQLYINAKLDRPPTETSRAPLLQGAVNYGNERHLSNLGTDPEADLAGEGPWSLTLVDAGGLLGEWRLSPQGSGWVLASIDLMLAEPDLIASGLVWLSNGKATIQDALPDLDNWVSGLQTPLLRTVKPSDRYPAPIKLLLEALKFEYRSSPANGCASPGDDSDPGTDTEAAVLPPCLGAWSFSFELDRGLIKNMADCGILPSDDSVIFQPLFWRRHATLPMIQALPLTQSKNPPNYPSASRQLAPFTIEPPEAPENPAWPFGVQDKNGAAAWPRLSGDAPPAGEWSSLFDLPLASLSLPGLSLDTSGDVDGFLSRRYRFDLPYTDQLNALAQLPKTPKDPSKVSPALDQPPPEPPKPLTRERMGEHWERLSEQASLAALDAVQAFLDSPDPVMLRHLIEPLEWPAKARFDLNSYPGSLTLSNADSSASVGMSGDEALRGVTGEFAIREPGKIVRLDPTEALKSGDIPMRVVSGSMAAHREESAENGGGGAFRDQRGLRRWATRRDTEGTRMFLETPVELDPGPGYLLLSGLEETKLRVNDQVWGIWFRDLPVSAGSFKRKDTRSTRAEDVNDPEALSRAFNFLNGYEWRLSDPSSPGPLKVYNLDFYPLTLERVDYQAGSLTGVEIVGRLQLPLPGGGELPDFSNAVRLVFSAGVGGSLELSSVELEPPQAELDGHGGEWPLATRGGEASDAPRLTWSAVALNADRSNLILSGVRLCFTLFDAAWTVDLPDPLEFDADLSTAGTIDATADLTPEVTGALYPTQARLTLDMLTLNHKVNVTVCAELSPQRRGLQALYTFDEGSGATVHDRSGAGVPLDLHADNESALSWTSDGLVIDAPVMIASAEPASRIIQAAQDTGELSLELWVRPASTPQRLARLTTISGTDVERNVTLGQDAPGHFGAFRAALRTSETSVGGSIAQKALVSSTDSVTTDMTHLVFTRDADGIARLYVNGLLADEKSIGGDFSSWDVNYRLVLANEVDGSLPWLGGYRLLAVYNRALSPAEIQDRFDQSIEGVQVRAQVRATFTALATFTRVGDEPWELAWDSGELFDDLSIEVRNSSDDPAILFDEKTLQFKWMGYRRERDAAELQLLPGMHLRPHEEAGDPTDGVRTLAEITYTPGFALFTFTAHPGMDVPELQLKTAFIEAMLACHWGEFLQGERDDPALGTSSEGVFGSSAGDLMLGYTAQWVGDRWDENLNLNGFVEIKNLVSWPTSMAYDPDHQSLTLPATGASGVLNALDHIRHTARIFFNQHNLPAELLDNGPGTSLLFTIAGGWSWQFLAVVEHQLVDVHLPVSGGDAQLGAERRWTAIQEVRLSTPSAFKKFLDIYEDSRSTSPVEHTDQLQDINYGYLGAGMRAALSQEGAAGLDRLGTQTLLVEASALHWIGLEELGRLSSTTLQFLPGGSQHAMLSNPDDFSLDGSSEGASERWPWLLLAMPFLGRLQDRMADGLEGSPGPVESVLQVDPILQIQNARAEDPPQSTAELALALSCWSESGPLSFEVASLDTALGRSWGRLDSNVLEENWFRIQHPARELPALRTLSVLAALPDTPARLSRSAALSRAFDTRIQAYPPQNLEGDSPGDPEMVGRLAWRQQSLLLAQGLSGLGRDHEPPYGWHLTGLQLLTSALLTTATSTDIELPVDEPGVRRYPAATVLPARPSNGDDSAAPRLSLAVSPYLGLDLQPAGDDNMLMQVVAELLCIDRATGELRPVASHILERPEPDSEAVSETAVAKALFEAAKEWAGATQSRLAPDSPVSILRFRELRRPLEEDRAKADLMVSYSFALVRDQDPPSKLARRLFGIRSSPAALRFRQGQFGGETMPDEPQTFELAPPQMVGVQPLYLTKRPTSKSKAPYTWPWGLSALRYRTRYTEQSRAVIGGWSSSSANRLTLWWQAPQYQTQFRSVLDRDEGLGAPVAGLPELFRAEPIKSLLPTLPDPPMPAIDLEDLELPPGEQPGGDPAANENGAKRYWQPVLPGALTTLLVGARAGAMLALRYMLIRQSGLAPDPDVGINGGQRGATLVSGSLPVAHRAPRPVPLDPNPVERKEVALQTWTSYFQPRERLTSGNWAVDEAFLAATKTRSAQRLRLKLIGDGFERATVHPEWGGALRFGVQMNGQNQAGGLSALDAQWDLGVELIVGQKVFSFVRDPGFTMESDLPGANDRDQIGYVLDVDVAELETKLGELQALLASLPPGTELTVGVSAEYMPDKDNFSQRLSFPLRIGDQFRPSLPLAPVFVHFEDPEYNRRLASSSFRVETIIQLPQKDPEDENNIKPVAYILALACDRREYNSDSRLALRYDWQAKGVDSGLYTDALEFRRVDRQGIKGNLLFYQGAQSTSIDAGELKQVSLLDLTDKNGTSQAFSPGDTLEITLKITPTGAATVPILLDPTIVNEPVTPAPEAGYALLRRQELGEKAVVECARFAWSPEPARIELVAPDDLRSDVVRRRAVFHWTDSVRLGRVVGHDLQKIAANGATHVCFVVDR